MPEPAKIVGDLYVFQRTPITSIDVRDQRATTDEERATWANEPGWARARRARVARISAGRTAYNAGQWATITWRSKVQEVKKHHERELRPGRADAEAARRQLSHHGADPRARRCDRQGSEDSGGAQALLPPMGISSRPFHDEYLPAFNLPHVHSGGYGTARGVRNPTSAWRRSTARGVEYPLLDVLIYATGFQWMGTSTFNMVTGRGGRTQAIGA